VKPAPNGPIGSRRLICQKQPAGYNQREFTPLIPCKIVLDILGLE
jgi:hypothetical protein